MAGAAQPLAFGPLLRELRQAAGLTQAALAERAGLSVRAIQHLERSLGQPQRETARRLADALALAGDQRARFQVAASPSPRARVGSRALLASPAVPPAGIELSPRQPGATVVPPPDESGGERKRLTILVAEVSGLTESARGFDADLADELLAEVLRALVDVVHRYEGTVASVRGDGLTALFGAPKALEDHAVRAGYAALALHEAFARRRDQIVGEQEIAIGLRVGLDSGEVVLRLGANDLAREYTALGPAVRGASRLAQHAADGTTVAACETLRLAEGYFVTRPFERSAGEDPNDRAEALELVAASPPRSRFQHVVSARQLTPFVGRDLELATLSRPIDRALAGHGQIVAVVGEPGVGKSRLIWELIRSRLADGWRVMETSAAAHGPAMSYLPPIDLLKRYCQIDPRDDRSMVSEKLTRALLRLDRALASDLPALLSLLDVPVDDPDWEQLDPPRRRRQTLDALRRLLLRESREQALALIVEDLHWIDAETQALLDSLVDSLPAASMLVVVSYRPEYAQPWSSRSYCTQLRVDSLAAISARELLGSLLGDDRALTSLGERLIDVTEGNPLFLEECVRALVDDGVLAGEPGSYRLVGSIETIRVPASVQAVLAARIDRLDSDTKRLLQAAAVIGKDVPFSLLQEVVGLDEDGLRQRLAHLQSAELLYEASLFPELELTFKHALTHEVTYGGLLRERRVALHARVVGAMERLYRDRFAEHLERIAHHALRGEEWGKAASYGRQAGEKLTALSANREAVRYFEQALAALTHLPEDRETMEQAVDVRLALYGPLSTLDVEQTLANLQHAERVAETLGDARRQGRASAYLTYCYWMLGDLDRAVAVGRRGEAAAGAVGDVRLQILVSYYLGQAFRHRGEYRRSVDAFEYVVAGITEDRLLERFAAGYPAVIARAWLASIRAELGEFDVGTGHARDAIQIAETIGQPYSLAAAYYHTGGMYLRRGRLEDATAALERGLAICEGSDAPSLFPMLASRLGAASTLAGNLNGGIRLLEQATEAAASMRIRTEAGLRAAWLSEAYVLAGRPERAVELAEWALELSVEQVERGNQAWVLRLLGDMAARRGNRNADEAETRYNEALALADELAMRPLQAHCNLGLGKLHRRTGRPDEASAELSAAVTMLREMGMAFWLPEAETELALLDGRPGRRRVATRRSGRPSARA